MFQVPGNAECITDQVSQAMVTHKITKSLCTYNTYAEEENSQKVHPCLDLNLLTIHLAGSDIKETSYKNAKNVGFNFRRKA